MIESVLIDISSTVSFRGTLWGGGGHADGSFWLKELDYIMHRAHTYKMLDHRLPGKPLLVEDCHITIQEKEKCPAPCCPES